MVDEGHNAVFRYPEALSHAESHPPSLLGRGFVTLGRKDVTAAHELAQ